MHARLAAARNELPRAARIAALAAASSRALAGEGVSHDVATARELIAAYRREDARPVAAILRRPLVLLCDELSGPAV